MKLKELLHHTCLEEILGRLHILAPHTDLRSFQNQYQLGGLLGKGGFASVYQATKKSDGSRVAVKMVEKDRIVHMDGDVPLEVALLHEVSDIPGVVHLLEHFDLGPTFAIVLESSPHIKDLFDVIEDRGHLDEEFSRKVFSQVVKTVIECHRHGVLHRDIKDENILISLDTLQVKLTDFGSSCHTTGREEFHKFEGTPVYAPPEWVGQHHYNGEALSVWELGVLLFSMLCGALPFHSNRQILAGKIIWKETVSPDAKDLVASCLTHDPNARIHLKDILKHPWIQDPEEKTVRGGEISEVDLLGESDDQGSQGGQCDSDHPVNPVDHLEDLDDRGSQGDKADKGDQGVSSHPVKSENGLKHQEVDDGERDNCKCNPKNGLGLSSDCCEFDPELLLLALQEDFV